MFRFSETNLQPYSESLIVLIEYKETNTFPWLVIKTRKFSSILIISPDMSIIPELEFIVILTFFPNNSSILLPPAFTIIMRERLLI